MGSELPAPVLSDLYCSSVCCRELNDLDKIGKREDGEKPKLLPQQQQLNQQKEFCFWRFRTFLARFRLAISGEAGIGVIGAPKVVKEKL